MTAHDPHSGAATQSAASPPGAAAAAPRHRSGRGGALAGAAGAGGASPFPRRRAPPKLAATALPTARSVTAVGSAPLDLAALAIFRSVADEGSVTRAAQQLARAQSNVTTRVRQLEADLGVCLFLREGKRMALTPEGALLRGYAERLLALAEEARQALQPGAPAGRLRLGAMESTAASRLPLPLARLHAQWPGVALELSTGPTQALLARLRAHTLDAACIAWPPGQGADPALASVPVCTEELLLVLPPGHGPVRGPADVAPGTLAVFGAGCTYRRIAQDWCAPRPEPLRLLELGSYHAILACVAGGGCAGVVPRSVLQLTPHAGLLHTHPLASIDTLLAWRRGYQSAALDALRAVLTDAADAADVTAASPSATTKPPAAPCRP